MTLSTDSLALLDTSVLIDFEVLPPDLLPRDAAITSLSLAELSSGPHATTDPLERARRQSQLQWATRRWVPLPFDVPAAAAYGEIYAVTLASGRSPRPRRVDLLIAAIALANGLPLYTRNFDDFSHLSDLMEVHQV